MMSICRTSLEVASVIFIRVFQLENRVPRHAAAWCVLCVASAGDGSEIACRMTRLCDSALSLRLLTSGTSTWSLVSLGPYWVVILRSTLTAVAQGTSPGDSSVTQHTRTVTQRQDGNDTRMKLGRTRAHSLSWLASGLLA